MGRAKENNAFVTIMTNINVLAVAALIDFSAVIICEDAELSQEFIETAKSKDINIVKSKLPSFETCALLSRIILCVGFITTCTFIPACPLAVTKI